MRKASTSRELVAPYVSFKTFQSGVQALRHHGLPGKIDRSVWASKSGADQAALLSAFRFLGLIGPDGITQPPLEMLAKAGEATAEEKNILRGVLNHAYADLFKENLETLTPAQFSEAIGKYGSQGSTRDRAMRFFVKAAAFCDIKMSGRLTARKTRSVNARGNGANAQRKGRKPEDDTPNPPQDTQGASAMKVIKLPGAQGVLVLSGTFNLFELAGSERELVFNIIDSMKDFESKTEEVQ